MRSRFRIVHFLPDPFSGLRIPIGALVEHGRSVRAAVAPSLPDARCVGGQAAWSLMRMLAEELTTANDFGELPRSFGPQAVLADEQDLPAGVADPVRWIEEHILPQPAAISHAGKSPARRDHAHKFFRTYGVERYVTDRFDGRLINATPGAMKPIDHFVQGRVDLLLMESLLTKRKSFASDVTDLSGKFLGCRQLFERRPSPFVPDLVAFAFGGDDDALEYARGVLRESGARLVDVETPSERDRLVRQIREVGDSAVPDGGLTH